MTPGEAMDSRLQALEQENRRLKRAVSELSILNELAVEVGSSNRSEEIIKTIVKRSLQAVNAEQGVITLIEPKSDQPLQTLIRTRISSGERSQFHFSESLLGWMQLNQRPLAINDPKGDSRFPGLQWDESIRSLLSVPLIIRSELRAVLTVYNKKGSEGFSEEDQRLLSIIAAQSGQVLENARLAEEEKALLQMREELRLASRIQQELLPRSPPDLPGYELDGTSTAAQQVGGDYFDFIPVGEHRFAVCLGDVSGKGLPASLLMANLQATIRGQTHADSAPRECIARSNRLLYSSTDASKFVTFFYGILDPRLHELVFCNAGHNPPLLFSGDDEPRRLSTGGMVLGVLEGVAFKDDSLRLREGDVLILYSDGITEAVNSEDEEFGEQRLGSVVQTHRAAAPTELIQMILAAVREHASGIPQADDMTMVVVKRSDRSRS